MLTKAINKVIEEREKYILSLIVVLLPFSMFYTNVFIFLFGFSWLIRLLKNEVAINLPGLSIMSASIYLACLIISLLYTQSDHLVFAWRKIESKLSLFVLILPIIWSSKKIQVKDIEFIFTMFSLTVLTTCILCYSQAVFKSGVLYDYFDLNFRGAYYLNPTKLDTGYFALYVALTIAFIANKYFINKQNKNAPFQTILVGLALLFLLFNLFLSNAKIGVIIGLVNVTLSVFYYPFKHPSSKLAFSTIFLVTIGSLFIASLFFTRNLYNEFILEAAGDGGYLNTRLTIWESAFKLFLKSPFFGYGIGDVKTLLASEYLKIGFERGHLMLYNSHNQMIEMALEVGLVGVLCYLSVLIFPLIRSFNNESNHRYFITCLYLNFVIFGTIEVFLARHEGIIVFSIFFSLLYILNKRN